MQRLLSHAALVGIGVGRRGRGCTTNALAAAAAGLPAVIGRHQPPWKCSIGAGRPGGDAGQRVSTGRWVKVRGYRVLELTAGLKVISITCTPDLRDWGTLLGPLGTLMSLRLAG